jgi:hypothetical protein
MLLSIGSPASPSGALQIRIGPVPSLTLASIGIPGEVAGAWTAPIVHGWFTSAAVSGSWSVPQVRSSWEVVA